MPVKVLDCDTISQAKEKVLDQLCKGLPLAQRPDSRTLDVGEGGGGRARVGLGWPGPALGAELGCRGTTSHLGRGPCSWSLARLGGCPRWRAVAPGGRDRLRVLDQAPPSPAEWRSGVAGHLILSDEDVTSEVQGLWRRLNTLQHYKVREGGGELEEGSGGRLAEGSPAVVSRSQTEQPWPWSPASPSTPFGKTRTMSLERVSAPLPPALCACSARQWCPAVAPGSGERTWTSVGLCLPPFHPEEPPQVPPTPGVGRTPTREGP